jgi:hypothetical protein
MCMDSQGENSIHNFRLKCCILKEDTKNDITRKESSIFRFILILYYVLTNLQFALKFICPFVIREGALRNNKVEDLVVVIIVINVTPNQLSIPYHAFHIRSALLKR